MHNEIVVKRLIMRCITLQRSMNVC